MAAIFLDTSGLFRRYFQAEPGAARVRAVCAPSLRNTLYVARFAPVEMASALARRVRDGTLTPAARLRRWRQFQLDWLDQYHIIEVTLTSYSFAERLVGQYPIRTLDALQLACALSATRYSARHRLQFWTADRQQAAAARAEGLDVEFVG